MSLLAVSVGDGRQPQAEVPAATGTGAISGVVVDGETNTPLPRVIVSLGPSTRPQVGEHLRELTGPDGRFVFVNLAARPDGYSVDASKFGYFDGHFGRVLGSQLGGRIVLRDGEWFANARVVMHRPSAISGTVTDERGDPVVGSY
ncbi:MAG TPA: carboxypeptidase-like regulatory domain-containing protein [Vicinamibacterales bacterium]|nr:carboxypeptidase-like regulatory domain-containing protein [Vicinamibacterales bacterium]